MKISWVKISNSSDIDTYIKVYKILNNSIYENEESVDLKK